MTRLRSDAPATLRDVARLAEVHPGTVSRALNEETSALVRPATAERVRQAAAQLGYRVNPIARGLRTNRSATVGVLVPDIQNPLFPPIVRGIEDELRDAGYTPLIANTENDPRREHTDFEALRARHVEGFITATARHDHAVLDAIVDAGFPVVLVNRRVADGALPSVTVDDTRGVALAVEHLAGLGHRRIAHLGGPQDLSTGERRYEGFVAAMRRAGIFIDPRLVRFGTGFTEREGAAGCRALLEDGRQFTAIVAGNDLIALGCYDALAECGIACPAGVSIVGFNDMPFAGRFSPPLTTIRIPHYEIGAAAARLLLEELADRTGRAPQVVLDPALVVRGSTATPGQPAGGPAPS